MEFSIDVDLAVVVPVNLIPLIDNTDFKTREMAIVYNEAGMDLVWNFQTTAGTLTQTAVIPTTAGVYDWVNKGDGMYGIEIPASGGGSINNDTEGFGWFTGVCTGVLPWRSPVFCFRAAATNNALINAASLIVEIAKAVWDRILNGSTHNIPQSAGRRVRSLGSALSFTIAADGGNTALTFKTDLPSTKDNFYNDQVIHGTDNENENATRIVESYDGTTKFITLDEALTDIPATGDGFELRPEHVHPVSQIIKTMLNTIVDGTYNIAKSWGKRLRGIEEYQGYEGGFIYIDTVEGTAGSDPYTNGTLDNPVNNMTDANSLAVALKMCCFKVTAGSILNFTASQEKQTFTGETYIVILGSQSISATTFHGSSLVSGIATGTIAPKFEDCNIGEVTLPPSHLDTCGLIGPITAGSAGSYFLADNCHSAVAGEGAPILDFGAVVGDVNVNLRWYSGGVDLRNMGQTGVDRISIEGNGQVIINGNCVGSAGSQIAIRGHQTRSGGDPFIAGGGVISDGARFAMDQIFDYVIGGNGDTLESLSGQIDGLLAAARVINIIAGGGALPSYATQGKPATIVQGDVVNIPRYVVGDVTGRRLFFAAKAEYDNTSYTIGEIECTDLSYDANLDRTSYEIPFVADDTTTVTPGLYKAEVEVRDSDGVSNPVTPDRFKFTVVNNIIG